MRLERRLDQPRWLSVAVPIGSLVVAFLLMAVVLLVTGHNPVSTYQRLFDSAFFANGALTSTLVFCTPIVFTGLAAAAAFRMQLYNIGGEGQFYFGAIAGVGIALYLGDRGVESTPVFVLAMVVAGMVAGAAWAAIPGSPPCVLQDERDHHLADAQLRRRARPHVPDHRLEVLLARPRELRGSDVPAGQADSGGGASGRASTSRALSSRSGSSSAIVVAIVLWVAVLADAVRVRAAGDRGLAADRPLRGHATPPEDPGRHVHLGGDRRASAARATRATSRTRSTRPGFSRRSSGTRASSSRRSPGTTRSPSCPWGSSSAGCRTRASRCRAPTSRPASSASCRG